MGKHQQHETQSADTYVSALTRGLRRHLPQEKAVEIAGEAQAHLQDRVGDLIECGVARPQAEAIATAGFGPVKKYTRAAIESAYGDHTSRRFQQAVRISLVVLTMSSLLLYLVSPNLRGTWLTTNFLPGLMSIAMLTFPLAALAGRLPQTRTLAAYIASLAVISFVVSGLCYVPYPNTPSVLISGTGFAWRAYSSGPGEPRGDYSARIAALDNHYVYQEISLLKQGIATYASNAPVPASLRQGGGYIVPKSTGWQWCIGDNDVLAFQEWPGYSHNPWDTLSQVERAQPFRTAATRDEAARIWHATAPKWLAGKENVSKRTEQVRGVLNRVAHAPLGFNTGAATYYSTNILWTLPFVLAIDFFLARLGRACWVVLRNRRRPHAA